MTTLRTALVGVAASTLAASVLALPAGGTGLASTATASVTPGASVSPAGVAPAAARAARNNTKIRFLTFDHTKAWSSHVRIRGQVAAQVGQRVGALRSARVTIYRQMDGRSAWVRLGSRLTNRSARPAFVFRVRAHANADYRVFYAGSARFQPSKDSTAVSVYRIFNPRLRDGSGRFLGRVRPNYKNKIVVLEKRRCASCSWKRVRSDRTSDRGRWQFKVGAPRSGRWAWRASTPGSIRYIPSHSAVFTTELR